MAMMSMITTIPLLAVIDAEVSIQAMRALRGFSLRLHAGEMIGLIGRNGAGKTTFMRAVMGHLKATAGTLSFDGQNLVPMAPERRAALGIGYMPEDRGLVPELTVEENILLPLWVAKGVDRAERLAFVYDLIPEVAAMKERRAMLLSGG
ncbi:MAG: ATP-binding cassette protein, partial [Rhizobacter sp.]|nr:ATP-binding cassette protein [Rhizobacter sp.]